MSNQSSQDDEPPRDAPTSDGADIARYSSSHKLQLSHAEDPLPKVVLDRAPMRPTVRVRTSTRVSGSRVVLPLLLLIAAAFLGLAALRRWGATQKIDALIANPSASGLVPVDAPRPPARP